jgi:lipopolysaccharide export system protein LptC
MGSPRWIALLAVLACAGSFWLWRLFAGQEGRAPGTGPHEPDYYIVDMVRHTMDQQGELQNVLIADRVYHYLDDDSTELARPRMEIYNDSASPWQVTAERGTVKSNGELVLLHGKVEIWRPDDDGEREFEILTSELRVFPKVQYAETDRAATLKSLGSVTRTRGFRANFSHNRLELLARVKSRIEKKQ